MEIFRRAVAAGAQLLRIERLDVGGSVGSDEREASAFVLTLDVGRVLIAAREPGGPLSVLHIENPEHLPSGLEDAAESEPWWRVMGQTLSRVADDAVDGDEATAREVTLQFRADNDNPRKIRMAVEGGRVRAGLG